MANCRTATPLPEVSHCTSASTVLEIIRTSRDPRMLALNALPRTHERDAEKITLGYKIAAEQADRTGQ